MKSILNHYSHCRYVANYIGRQSLYTGSYCIAVSEVLATNNENGSQITCYAVNGDWVFIMYYVLKSIDHAISVQHWVLQELWKPQYVIIPQYVISFGEKSLAEHFTPKIGE